MSKHEYVSHGQFQAEAPKASVGPEVEVADLEHINVTAELGHSAVEVEIHLETEAERRNKLIKKYMDKPATGEVSADELRDINQHRESSARAELNNLTSTTEGQDKDIAQGRAVLAKLIGKPSKIPTEEEKREELERAERMVEWYKKDPAYDLSDIEYPGESLRNRSGHLHSLVTGIHRMIQYKRDRFGSKF